jgi:hypothetical protein
LFDHKKNKKEYDDELIRVDEFIGVKSEKAKGKRLTNHITRKIEFVEPLPYEEEKEEKDEQDEDEAIQQPPEREKEKEEAQTEASDENVKIKSNPDTIAKAPDKKAQPDSGKASEGNRANNGDDDGPQSQIKLEF